ncbi:MAG: DNA gyrase subunit A [Patescibacteria group bacterium]
MIEEEKNLEEAVPAEADATGNDEAVFQDGVGLLKPRELVAEMEISYLDYAMSVIVSRALPDVRDGLKPVHRRVLYAMYDTGLSHSAKYRKSAKVVGEVIANYHPHGDMAVYDTLVRLAQDFSMRYTLVDGQGNFGSMDGDSAAAMRYTECRMTAIAEEMAADIDKETVDWQENYDGTTREPEVMPARIPQLLLNGSMGIAVGMATNIPPHNLKELCEGIIHLITNPEAGVEDLMKHIKGPDFPTGGNIYNIEDIKTAYTTGKGRIMMRAKADIEESKRGWRIIITEIPYQVNKAAMIEKIADLVKSKRIEGISDIRDESDRHGVRVVIELRANSYPKKVLNKLYEMTPMQTAFHVNMLALTPDLEPRVMDLRDICTFYIQHRQTVIERRTRYELKKAKERAHILEGLRIALDHIDEVINTIRASANREDAHKNLVKKFDLSSIQASAILDMRLSALAALERKKIEDEYEEVLRTIARLEDILAHPKKILGLIKEDLLEVVKKYGDERRTTIVPQALGEFRAEDLIPDEQVIVSITRGSYIKRQDVGTYRKQVRGGVGILGMTTKEEDIVAHLVCANTHDDIYFFTDRGRVFKNKVYEVPATSRLSKGTPIVNIIQLAPREQVTAFLTVSKQQNGQKYFIMGTVSGQIKRTEISQYDHIRKTGIIAIGLKGNDKLKWVKTSTGGDVVVEVTEHGQAICYPEEEVRPMGRGASGVTGMRLKGNDQVMSMDVVPGKCFTDKATQADMLVVLENGFGKRTRISLFHLQKRGGYGMLAANCTHRTGNVIGMHMTYSDFGDVVLASCQGQFIRLALVNIKKLGRDTQGVTLMKLRPGDKVSSVALITVNDSVAGEPPAESGHIPDAPTGDSPSLPDNIAAPGPAVESGASDTKDSSGKEIGSPVKETVAKKSEEKVALNIHSYKKENVSVEPTETPKPETKERPAAAQQPDLIKEISDRDASDLKIQSYKNSVMIEDDRKTDVRKNAPQNPPIAKESVNYWGKQ